MGRSAGPRHRPSEAARHRLADAIRRNRAELEVQVAEGLLRSELYLETGHPDVAAEVLEEQRARVREFELRLQRVLACAAVEAEAEAVLAGAEGVHLLHEDAPAPSRLPQLVAAAVAAVAALGVLFAADVSDRADQLRASVRIDSTDQPAATGLDVWRPGTPDALRFRSPAAGSTGAAGAEHGADEAVTRRWLAEQDTLLERLGVRMGVRTQVLRELEGLVAQLIPGTALADEVWLKVLSEAVAAQGAASGRPAPDGSAGDDAPGTTEAPADGDADGSEGSWFGDRGTADEDERPDEQPQETAARPTPSGDEQDADADGEADDGDAGTGMPAPGTGSDQQPDAGQAQGGLLSRG